MDRIILPFFPPPESGPCCSFKTVPTFLPVFLYHPRKPKMVPPLSSFPHARSVFATEISRYFLLSRLFLPSRPSFCSRGLPGAARTLGRGPSPLFLGGARPNPRLIGSAFVPFFHRDKRAIPPFFLRTSFRSFAFLTTLTTE